MEGAAPRPVTSFDGESAAKRKDYRRRQSAYIHARQPLRQKTPPGRRIVNELLLRQGLRIEEQADRRPHEEAHTGSSQVLPECVRHRPTRITQAGSPNAVLKACGWAVRPSIRPVRQNSH